MTEKKLTETPANRGSEARAPSARERSGGGPASPAWRRLKPTGNVSTIPMIVAGVGLAAGVTLWLTAPARNSDSPGAPAAAIGFGFGSVQLKRAF